VAVSGTDIAGYAQQFIGTPYQWGGNSLTSGVDCSGLVQQVYKNFGINLPRTTYSQIGVGKGIGMNELVAGDLVFFDTDPKSKGADHVGIYIGNGMMIHAPRPGKNVEVSSLSSGYYQSHFLGARRVSGVQGGGTAGDWDPTDTKNLSPEEMAASYGWSYAFLNSNPTLKKLFSQAVDGGWNTAQFQAHLYETKWWKENSMSMKQAQAEKATDPATYNAKLAAAKVQVLQLAGEMGASIPHNKLGQITEQVVTLGLDENLLRDVLGKYIKFQNNGSTLNGEAGQFEHDLRQYAYQQGVKLDKQTIKNQAQLIARKLATPQDFKNQITEQAISMYPSYAEQLKGGETMMDVANPYIQQMAQDLEIPLQNITLDDPIIKRALNGLDAKGKPTGMDISDFESLLRNDPRWRQTQKAQNNVMSAGKQVLKDMGLIKES
jgi:NlpC/P60 family protein